LLLFPVCSHFQHLIFSLLQVHEEPRDHPHHKDQTLSADEEQAYAFFRAEHERLLGTKAPENEPTEQLLKEVVDRKIEESAELVIKELIKHDKPREAQALRTSATHLRAGLSLSNSGELVTALKEDVPAKRADGAAVPTWSNWNLNQATSAHVVHPKTLHEMVHAVKNTNKKIRVAGFGHSWSPIIATHEDSEDTLLIATAGNLNHILSSPEDVIAKKNITFEAGVSVQSLQDWIDAHHIPLTVGANVVLTEVHMVAVATSLCHGAGYEWASIADMIKAISIIDADGNLTTFTASDPSTLAIPTDSHVAHHVQRVSEETLNHYRGTLGLLGVIYAITLDLVEATTLQMTGLLVPVKDFLDVNKFEKLIEENNGWIELFWVPNAPKVWVQTWKRAPGQPPHPFRHRTWDHIGEILGKFAFQIRQTIQKNGLEFPLKKQINDAFMKMVYEFMIICVAAGKSTHYYRWFDSLHYRDYINDMRVEDTEFAFPIKREDGQTSPYQTVVTAFTLLHDIIEQNAKKGDYPCDLTVEMRFTAGSHATLAHYPASISSKWVHLEFLSYTVQGVDVLEKRWIALIQQIANHWIPLGGHPHWAKGWQTIEGVKELLRNKPGVKQLSEFRRKVDPNGRFLNAQLTPIFQ